MRTAPTVSGVMQVPVIYLGQVEVRMRGVNFHSQMRFLQGRANIFVQTLARVQECHARAASLAALCAARALYFVHQWLTGTTWPEMAWSYGSLSRCYVIT